MTPLTDKLVTVALVPVWLATASTAICVHAVMQVPALVGRAALSVVDGKLRV